MSVLTKRQLESYKRAEELAREVRYQISDPRCKDRDRLAYFLEKWMKVADSIKYERPEKPE